MATLADLRTAADSSTPVMTVVDETTPEGTFAALTVVHRIPSAYLLRGDLDDESAVILGQVEAKDGSYDAYRGSNIMDNEWFMTVPGDSTEAFAVMAS